MDVILLILIFVHVLAGAIVGAEFLSRYLDEKLTAYFEERENGRHKKDNSTR